MIKVSAGQAWKRWIFREMYSDPYRGYRYPSEIISRCVWQYHHFPLSFREAEKLTPRPRERGVLGKRSSNGVRSSAPPTPASSAAGVPSCQGDKWHLDEVFVRISGLNRQPAGTLGAGADRGVCLAASGGLRQSATVCAWTNT